MLFSHLGEYGCEWAYKCNLPLIGNDHKVIDRHLYVFVIIRSNSRGVTNIRNMHLKFARKAYSHCFRNILVSKHKPFLMMARHL